MTRCSVPALCSDVCPSREGGLLISPKEWKGILMKKQTYLASSLLSLLAAFTSQNAIAANANFPGSMCDALNSNGTRRVDNAIPQSGTTIYNLSLPAVSIWFACPVPNIYQSPSLSFMINTSSPGAGCVLYSGNAGYPPTSQDHIGGFYWVNLTQFNYQPVSLQCYIPPGGSVNFYSAY